jgi:hypothetical protein
MAASILLPIQGVMIVATLVKAKEIANRWRYVIFVALAISLLPFDGCTAVGFVPTHRRQ